MTARVLVTGGTGVIGAWVVRGLVERGVTPIVFTRGQTDAIGNAINGDITDRVISARGDLSEGASIEEALRTHKAEVVVHMASAKPWQMEPPWTPEPDAALAIRQIGLATLNVVEAARHVGVRRVVYASSKAVYADIAGKYAAPTYEPLPEDYQIGPSMLYGVGKLTAEQLGFYFARRYELEFLAIRFSSAYGPLKRGPAATSPDGMLYAALAGDTVRIRAFEPGAKDDYAYNKDIAEGFVAAALAPTVRHAAYNLGSGRGIDHNDIAAALRAAVPSVKVEFVDSSLGGEGTQLTDRARCVMDISRAGEDFGWRPRFAAMADAFRDFISEERRMGRLQEAAIPR